MEHWKQEILDAFERSRAARKREELDFWEDIDPPRTLAHTLFLSLAIVAATATVVTLILWM